MIQSFFRNSLNFGILSTLVLAIMILMTLLMGLVVVLFSFPACGERVADLVGHGRFAEFVQLLF